MRDLETEMTDFENSQRMLTGMDYPELCQVCQDAITACAEWLMAGPDREDIEAPCNMAYDNRMFCGGHQCINKPKTQETIPIDTNEIYTDDSVYRRNPPSWLALLMPTQELQEDW